MHRLPALFDDPYQNIPASWQELLAWPEDSPYPLVGYQCLEEHLKYELTRPGQWSLDLYLLIVA